MQKSVKEMTKKERQKFYSSQRNDWGAISPVTRIVKPKKGKGSFSRSKLKNIDY